MSTGWPERAWPSWTTPGLRALEKYAVRCGGGQNHRFGLYDATLLKDNHVRLAGGVVPAVERLRTQTALPLELEVDTLAQLEEGLRLGVERILLDNMTVAEVAEAVALTQGRALLEVSGGITLDTVRAYAEAGPDFISVGALTHSARSLDVSLEVM
jgi:nicotinate-nucleotide pyrophosphorylase (carboxylating)